MKEEQPRLVKQTQRGVTVLRFQAPITVDASVIPDIEDQIARRLTGVPLLVLDASEVRFFDSDGMDLLIDLHQRLREQNGVLVLTGLDRGVREVFALAGLDCLLTITDTKDEAVRTAIRESCSPETWH